MKLMYRGTTYDYDPTQAKIDRSTQIIHQKPYDLIYRGVSYRVDPRILEPISSQAKCYELIYRGCTYQVTRNEVGEMTSIHSSTKLYKQQTLEDHSVIPAASDKLDKKRI